MSSNRKVDLSMIDPETGILKIEHWGKGCGRGFISSDRFGDGQIIKRTDRKKSRKWRQLAREEFEKP